VSLSEPELNLNPTGRRPGQYLSAVVAWGVIAYLGGLVGYGTWAWIERAAELWQGENVDAAVAVVGIGIVASLLPLVVVIGVRLSGSPMSLRASALYGLALSMMLLIMMTVAFNI